MSKLHYCVLKADSIEWSDWNDFVSREPLGTFFHCGPWLIAMAEHMAHDLRIHAIRRDGRFIAGLAVRCASKLGIHIGRKPWATAYNGLVVSRDALDTDIQYLLVNVLREYSYIRLTHPPSSTVPARFCASWNVSNKNTLVVQIQDLASAWERFDRRVRQRVRKATDAGINCTESDQFAAFYSLYIATYGRQGIDIPIAERAFTSTLAAAQRLGVAQLHMAYTASGEPAAGLFCGYDCKRVYFVLAASHPVFRKTDAATLLWWKAFQEYSASHTEVDLVGLGTPGIQQFKLSFAPTFVAFYETTLIPNVILRSGLRLYTSLKTRRAPTSSSIAPKHG